MQSNQKEDAMRKSTILAIAVAIILAVGSPAFSASDQCVKNADQSIQKAETTPKNNATFGMKAEANKSANQIAANAPCFLAPGAITNTSEIAANNVTSLGHQATTPEAGRIANTATKSATVLDKNDRATANTFTEETKLTAVAQKSAVNQQAAHSTA